MKSREILFTAVLLSLATVVYSQRASAEFVAETPESEGFYETKSISSAPYIETILYNPKVVKKQLSKNEIQALGLHKDNKTHFVVHFHKDKLHNSWKSFYTHNTLCDSGFLNKGLPEGEWKTWYPNGQLKTVRNYSATKYHYIEADIHRNHPRYQKYKITEYKQKRNNISHYFQPQYASNVEGANAKALLEKINHNTTGDGSSYVAPFDKSLHHGAYINYNADGTVRDSGHYDNGLKHGIWLETEKEGTIRSFGFYQHGHRSGQWKHYDLKGTLLYNDFYKKNGVLDTRHHFKR